MSSILSISLISLLLYLTSSQLSPLCDKSISNENLTIDSSALVGHHLLLFTGRTVTVVDITNDKEPIVAFNTFEEHFKVCGENISNIAPIEVSYALEDQNPNTNLILVAKNANIYVEMNDYWPSKCTERIQSKAVDKNILDSFMVNKKQADLLNVNGTIIMQWYDEVGYKQRGYLYFDLISGVDRIALISEEPEIALNDYDITTGIVIPKSVNNSFMTTDTLILLANRLSVELPLELDKWFPLEIKDFSSDICRKESSKSSTIPNTTSVVITPLSETNNSKLILIIVLSIIVVSVLLAVISVIYYMNVKSKKRIKVINRKVRPSNKKSSLGKSIDSKITTGTVSLSPSATSSTIKTVKSDE